MSDQCFVDTNILVNAYDRSAGVKHRPARMLVEQLWDSGRGVLSTQVQSVIQALDIEVRDKISFWDALILQAAESSGAPILYSEDLASGQSYGSIRVVNPLTGSASQSNSS